jgi:hypothetical protein
MEVMNMKVMLNCNQAGRHFEGIEVEASPQPLVVTLTTPKGVFEVEISESTIMTGILPALRSFVLSNAKVLGIAVTSNSSAPKREGRIRLKK